MFCLCNEYVALLATQSAHIAPNNRTSACDLHVATSQQSHPHQSVVADFVPLHRSTLQNEPAPPGAGYLPAVEDPDRRQSLGFRSREPPEALQS